MVPQPKNFYMYAYCVVCYWVIAASHVRSVLISLQTITLLMMIQNAQWTMSFIYSRKCFFYMTYESDIIQYSNPLVPNSWPTKLKYMYNLSNLLVDQMGKTHTENSSFIYCGAKCLIQCLQPETIFLHID